MQCILGNFKYGGEQNSTIFFVIADSTLKEYVIIILIYNRKTCKLYSIHFSVPRDVIL